MSRIVLQGYIQVPPDELEVVLREMDDHICLTRAEPGCLVFEITPDEHDRCRFDVYEEFSDRGAFERHQARVRRSQWGAVTRGVARHYEITEVDPG